MPINTVDLTTQVINGTGAFDALMHTVKLHLQEEFDASRINGSDYTTAYIQLMGTAMQVAVQYAISKPSEEAKVAEMKATLPFVIANAESTASRTAQEVLHEEAKVAEMNATLPYVISNAQATASKTAQEVLHEEAKVAEMNATLPYVISNAESTASKSAQEVLLLWEKTMTERANTQEVIFGGYGSPDGIPVLGVVGKQKALYQNQADGYLKDHKVKVAKLYADVAAVQLSSNDVYSTAGNGLEDVNIATAMSNLLGSM